MVTLNCIPKKPKRWPSQKHREPTHYPSDMTTGYVSSEDIEHPIPIRPERRFVAHVAEGHRLAFVRQQNVSSTIGAGQIPIASIYAAATEQNPHIGLSPNMLGGKPCIKGTRIPVALVLRYLTVDEDPVQDLEITQKDVKDCLKFAATVCDQPTRHVD